MENNKDLYSKEAVISTVSEKFCISIEDILAKTRKKEIVEARQVVAYCLRYLCEMSFPAISAMLGGRDHTTAIHSYKAVINRMDEDKRFRQKVGEILRSVDPEDNLIPEETYIEEIPPEVSKTVADVCSEENRKIALPTKNLEISDRERKIMDMYRQGKTLHEIAHAFDLTRERIRQIVFKVNLKEIATKTKDGFEMDIEEYIKGEKLTHEAAKNIIPATEREVKMNLYMSKVVGCTSVAGFAHEVKLRVSTLKKLFPEIVEAIKKNKEEKRNRWTRFYIKCRGCGTTKIPHMRKGYCEQCVGKKSYKTRKSMLSENSVCVHCGMDRGSAIRKFGRELYITQDNKILCRKCFLSFTGTKLGQSRKNRIATRRF